MQRRVRSAKSVVKSGPAVRFVLVAFGASRPRSAHSAAEMGCLGSHARGRRRLAELGVEQGAGTATLKRAMARDGVLYAVDPHPPGRLGVSFPRLIARIHVGRASGGAVRWLRTTDAEAAIDLAAQEPHGLDLVFSDCVFEYGALERLWASWRGQIVPGGIFIQSTSHAFGSRTSSEHGTVRFARDVLLRDPDFELVEVVETFTVLRRKC